ncbi:MAG TPA: hypothetical protein DIW47_06315 [Bacteroidetes bacterium]|nr:hypothetical protein [Bacteroidota bacterium]
MKKQSKNNKAVISELKSLLMISGGMILGTMGGKALDTALKVDDTLPGFQAKKLIKPAVQLGAGVLGAIKIKDPNLKLLAAGVGASGVVSTVKVVLKKDLLAGLGNPLSNVQARRIYQDPVRIAVNRYTPDLPQLQASTISEYEYNDPIQSNVVEADFEII